MRRAGLAVALLALATPAPAQDDVRDRFVEAVRLNGCSVSEAEAGAVLEAAGLTMEQVDGVAEAMLAEGVGHPAGDVFHLSDALCGDAVRVRPDPMAVLIGALREAGCTMTQEAAADTLPGLGLTEEVTGEVAEAMVRSGEATLEGDALRLSPALCAAPAP